MKLLQFFFKICLTVAATIVVIDKRKKNGMREKERNSPFQIFFFAV